MRRIFKRVEPTSLTEHRHKTNSNYDNYQDKGTLRAFLVIEQRGICCYCLSRIQPEIGRMKIEHWHSQAPDRYPAEQLAYSNLLGACMGNEGQPRRLQHCDTRKGDDDLWRNPADPGHAIQNWVSFEGDGTISSQDQAFDRELNEVLNLNVPFLKNERKAVLEAFILTLKKRGELQTSTLERWLRDWNGESRTDELRPYCQVVIYWLRKRLARS